MPITCPNCNDENTQRLSLVFESGFSNVSTVTKGTAIGFARGGIGIGLGSSATHGTSQTILSQHASPPKKASYLLILACWFIASLLAPLFEWLLHIPKILEPVISFGIFAAAAYGLFRSYMFNQNQWPSLFQKWQQSYMCMKCSNIFEVD